MRFCTADHVGPILYGAGLRAQQSRLLARAPGRKKARLALFHKGLPSALSKSSGSKLQRNNADVRRSHLKTFAASSLWCF